MHLVVCSVGRHKEAEKTSRSSQCDKLQSHKPNVGKSGHLCKVGISASFLVAVIKRPNKSMVPP